MLHGDRRRRTPRLDIAWQPNSIDHPRLGIIVPRYGHTAVRRNRLRRQLRDYSRRRILPHVPPIDLVIRTRPAAYQAPVTASTGDLERWLGSFHR